MNGKLNFNSPIVWAIGLVLIGLLVLLSATQVINIADNIIFYIAIGVIGILLHVVCFIGDSKEYGLLVPGGILFVYSILFIVCEYSPSINIGDLWPVLILAVGFGLLEQKFFSKGDRGSWISIILMFAIGMLFLVQENLGFGIALGTIFIIVGIIIGVVTFRKKQNNQTQQAEDANFEFE